jgi:2-amino-4-hydroxy-6-hydroxymethyldihydropteridine diphosphokinase
MILIALGANLPSRYGTPAQTLRMAVEELHARGVEVVQRSKIWLTAPVPFDADQPWYHNSVIEVKTDLLPHDLLDLMLNIEEKFGRVRSVKNAPRLLDLDLIAYHNEIIKDKERLIVPHPRCHERLFVLKPLSDISNVWTHPVLGQNVTEMIQNLPDGQEAKVLEEAL